MKIMLVKITKMLSYSNVVNPLFPKKFAKIPRATYPFALPKQKLNTFNNIKRYLLLFKTFVKEKELADS